MTGEADLWHSHVHIHMCAHTPSSHVDAIGVVMVGAEGFCRCQAMGYFVQSQLL